MSLPEYAAAEITFLDRASKTETAYTYPVTRVVLRERDNPENGRLFIVQKDGSWVEEER